MKFDFQVTSESGLSGGFLARCFLGTPGISNTDRRLAILRSSSVGRSAIILRISMIKRTSQIQSENAICLLFFLCLRDPIGPTKDVFSHQGTRSGPETNQTV